VLDRLLAGVVALAAVLAAVGMVLLWPEPVVPVGAEQPPLVAGRVLSVGEPVGGLLDVRVEVLGGDRAGEVLDTEVAAEGFPGFRPGDVVDLYESFLPEEGEVWFVIDFRRRAPLVWLGVLFVGAVLLVGRWRGLRALAGLGVSLGVVFGFILPAILGGASPPLVALVGGTAVVLGTLFLTHGAGRMTLAAATGTLGALVLTVSIGVTVLDATRITGFASEDAVYAGYALGGLDLAGLVLAGLIVGALGVLDDVAVAQASTVAALHEADPGQSVATLFARAMRVGRDHIASVVNTLVLAYVGASMGLLVLFSTSGLPTVEILASEQVATEIVRTIVGSLGLIAAVPLTTAVAAAVLAGDGRSDPDGPGGDARASG
jgi:uncharacterized membrane protein